MPRGQDSRFASSRQPGNWRSSAGNLPLHKSDNSDPNYPRSSFVDYEDSRAGWRAEGANYSAYAIRGGYDARPGAHGPIVTEREETLKAGPFSTQHRAMVAADALHARADAGKNVSRYRRP